MFHRSLLACALLIACAGPAIAQDSTAAQTTPSTPKPVKERKVCRQDIATGSIMPRNTCHTKAEWASIDASNSANADQFRSQMHGTGPGGRGN